VASSSHSSLSAVVTCEQARSALSSTYFQLTGGGGEPGEPRRSSLTTPRPVAPENPGARATSPKAVHPGMLGLTPHTTKHQATPHAYREDTRRKALRWAFLGRGSAPPELYKDNPAVTTLAPLATDMHDETCEISGK
jgi:hypothetical protein